MKATNFSLPDQNGTVHTLRQYHGKWVILYFYPKDDTPGCTKEACNFRDSIDQFQKLCRPTGRASSTGASGGVVILGVSKDSVASHKKFAQKYNLNFTILSDESKKVIKAYHAWGVKKFLGKEFEGTLRTTYLINPSGEIQKVYEKVNPLVHSGQILSDLKSFVS